MQPTVLMLPPRQTDRSSRHSLWPALLAILTLAWPSLLFAGQEFERWYAVEMGGQPAGYMHAVRTTDGEHITSRSKVHLSVGRGDINLTISIESSFIETAAGQPISMSTVETLGLIPKTTHYTFGPEEISIRLEQAGQITQSTRPLPEGKWLTPAAAEKYLRKRLAANADRIVARTIDPFSGPEPSIVTRTGITPMELEVMGRTISVFRCNTTSSATPGVDSTEYLDAGGIPVKLSTQMGPLSVTMTLADRETALAGHGAELAPELMQSTFIRPDRRIASPRTTTRATYVLRMPEGDMPDLPSTSVQRVEAVDPRAVRILIDSTNPQPADVSSIEDAAYLESSSLLNTQDPAIRRLTERALRDVGDDPAERAEAMRRFVFRFIRDKALDVGFASASEVARSRQGDCTEHGVLLAAMLRIDGIPARVASGLIYADRFAGERHIFGYHMWTQALIEIDGKPTWVDLDATLPPAIPFDATHITLAVSALRDGEGIASMSALLPLIGRLQVEVESFE